MICADWIERKQKEHLDLNICEMFDRFALFTVDFYTAAKRNVLECQERKHTHTTVV